MTSQDIKKILAQWSLPYHQIFIPEFTWGNLRVDALILDLHHRWVRAFEIKTSRADFNRDDKFALYTQFCSSISIVCPENLIQPEEVEKPFGLLWVPEDGISWGVTWKKRPQNFQKRRSMAWIWTYIKILEFELPRMQMAIRDPNWPNKYKAMPTDK